MFLKRRGGQGDATGEVLTKKKAEIFIVFVRRAEWEFDAPPVWRTKIYSNVGNHNWS